jgi:hypothetical protein
MTLSRCKSYDHAYKATLLNGTLRVQFGGNDIQIKTQANTSALFTMINLYNPTRLVDKEWREKCFRHEDIQVFCTLDEYVRSML